MNFFSDLIPLSSAAIGRASVHGALAALAVAGVCRVAPTIPPRVQAWLWRLVVAKFVIALFVAVPIPIPNKLAVDLPFSVSPVAAATTADVSPALAPASGVVVPTATSAANSVETSELPSHSFPLLPSVFFAWMTIAAFLLLRIGVACRNAGLLRNRCRPSDEVRLLESLTRFSNIARLTRPPQLLTTCGGGSPLQVGILRPAVVVPTTTLERLTSSERDLVLGHELAHIVRRDLFFSLVAAIVRAVFFFHPLAWLAERRLALAQEIAADEMAIAMQNQRPVDYATLLVAIVGKLGPAGGGRSSFAPLMSVGAAGNRRSLAHRLSALRNIGGDSSRISLASGLLLSLCAAFAAVPMSFTSGAAHGADEPTPATKNDGNTTAAEKPSLNRTKQPAAKATTAKLPIGKGNFVSFENGVLTLDGQLRPSGNDPGRTGIVTWANIDDNVKTYVVVGEDKGPDRGYGPAPTLETLKNVKPGTPIFVGPWFGYSDRPGIFVGSAKIRMVGTFVSYTTGSKSSGLTMLGKDLAPSGFTKKYGNNLFMRGIKEDTPVEESIDGGPFKPVGTVKTILKDVKEGTLMTVHFHGEGNITLIQLGRPKE